MALDHPTDSSKAQVHPILIVSSLTEEPLSHMSTLRRKRKKGREKKSTVVMCISQICFDFCTLDAILAKNIYCLLETLL